MLSIFNILQQVQWKAYLPRNYKLHHPDLVGLRMIECIILVLHLRLTARLIHRYSENSHNLQY